MKPQEPHAGRSRRKQKKLDLNWVKEKEIIEKSANKFIVLIDSGMQGLENILYSTYRHNTRGLSGFSLLKIRYIWQENENRTENHMFLTL